jgi:hypothetical protein
MTTTLSAAALRMPHMASVAAAAPLALAASAEPCAPMAAVRVVNRVGGSAFGGIIAPASTGRLNGTDGGDRFDGITRSNVGSGWYRQDEAQLAGGGPLRG